MIHDGTSVVLAATPFLPSGKGAIILILGGLAMLAFSLFVVRLMSKPQAPAATTVRRAAGSRVPVVFTASRLGAPVGHASVQAAILSQRAALLRPTRGPAGHPLEEVDRHEFER